MNALDGTFSMILMLCSYVVIGAPFHLWLDINCKSVDDGILGTAERGKWWMDTGDREKNQTYVDDHEWIWG